MKTSKLKQVMWLFLTASLLSISHPTRAEWIGKASKEVDYFGRELSVPPKIGLLENTQPVTHKLTGKVIYLKFTAFSPNEPSIGVIHFDDDKWITVWEHKAPEKSYKYSYVVFEIAKNIYYLNWVENTVPDVPQPDLPHAPQLEGAWLAAIVLDLNKMVATDVYTAPTEEGKVRYYIEQATAAVEDIDKAKGDKHYLPRGFAANNR